MKAGKKKRGCCGIFLWLIIILVALMVIIFLLLKNGTIEKWFKTDSERIAQAVDLYGLYRDTDLSIDDKVDPQFQKLMIHYEKLCKSYADTLNSDNLLSMAFNYIRTSLKARTVLQMIEKIGGRKLSVSELNLLSEVLERIKKYSEDQRQTRQNIIVTIT